MTDSEMVAVSSSMAILLSGTRNLEKIIRTIIINRINEELLSLRVKPNQFLNGSMFNFIFTKNAMRQTQFT